MDFDLIPLASATGQAITITNLEQLNLKDIIYIFAALAILFAGGLSIVFIFFGGFSFILSGGDEAKVKQAIHTIRYAIIGLGISLVSIVIVPFIGKLFGINLNLLDRKALSEKYDLLYSIFVETPAKEVPEPAATDPTKKEPAPASVKRSPNPDLPLENLIQ